MFNAHIVGFAFMQTVVILTRDQDHKPRDGLRFGIRLDQIPSSTYFLPRFRTVIFFEIRPGKDEQMNHKRHANHNGRRSPLREKNTRFEEALFEYSCEIRTDSIGRKSFPVSFDSPIVSLKIECLINTTTKQSNNL